jgi:integrase
VTEEITDGTVVPRASQRRPAPAALPAPAGPPGPAGPLPPAAHPAYGHADYALPPEAAALIGEAVPENTSVAYGSRWRSFEKWCADAGRVPLPATAQTIAAYLTHLVTRGLKATTVDAHLTAIRTVHRAAGQEPPDALAARKIVVAAQKREARRDGRYGPRKALPLLAADLPVVVAALDTSAPAGRRDRAVLLLGFALLARRSELAALNISDIEHVPGEGLEVIIRSSKTDQSARGVIRRIHYASRAEICPVRAVLAWLEFLSARGITAGPLFTRVDRWGNVDGRAGGRYRSADARDGRLRPQAIGDIIAASCAAAGLGDRDTRRFTGHSVRRGGATAMLRAGAEPLNVSRHGRWSDGSRVFSGYVEEATGFGDGNPTRGLL